ncbi:hypothetical protein V8E36_002640 [Tilletia maclaganii]
MSQHAQAPPFAVHSSDAIAAIIQEGRRHYGPDSNYNFSSIREKLFLLPDPASAPGSVLVRTLSRSKDILELDTIGAGPYGPAGELYILEAFREHETQAKLTSTEAERKVLQEQVRNNTSDAQTYVEHSNQAIQALKKLREEVDQARTEQTALKEQRDTAERERDEAQREEAEIQTRLVVADDALMQARQEMAKSKSSESTHPLLTAHAPAAPPVVANAWSPRLPAAPLGTLVPSYSFGIPRDTIQSTESRSFMRGCGRYYDLVKIRSGSQAHVFVARDAMSPSPVAIKATGAIARRAFPESAWREIAALSRVQHLNLAGIRDVMLTNDQNNHLVHLDIKPSNVLITSEGAAKIADLGLAEDTRAAHPDFRNYPVGTLWFRAPEALLRAVAIDTSFDIWGWSVTYAELLSGERRPIFQAEDPCTAMSLIASSLLPARKSSFGEGQSNARLELWAGAYRLPGAVGSSYLHANDVKGQTRFEAGDGPDVFFGRLRQAICTDDRTSTFLIEPLVSAMEINPILRPSAKTLLRSPSWSEGPHVTAAGYRPPEIERTTRHTRW